MDYDNLDKFVTGETEYEQKDMVEEMYESVRDEFLNHIVKVLQSAKDSNKLPFWKKKLKDTMVNKFKFSPDTIEEYIALAMKKVK